MKLILLSDCHLIAEKPIARIDDVLISQFNKLIFIFEYAIKNGIGVVLQSGDLVDVKRSWDLVQELAQFLKLYEGKVALYSVRGQHCSYYHDVINTKTIVGVLTTAGLVRQLSSKGSSIGENVYIYGSSWGEVVPEVKTKGINILVIHKQILMKKSWKGQKKYEYAAEFLAKYKKYDLILCGDQHQRFLFTDDKGRVICNTGPLLRLEASKDMINHFPGFYVYSTKTRKCMWVDIPHNPASKALTREHIKDIKEERAEFNTFVNEILGEGVSKYNFEAILRKYLEKLEKEGSGPNSRVRKILSEVMADE